MFCNISLCIQCTLNVYSICIQYVFNVYSMCIQCYTLYMLFSLMVTDSLLYPNSRDAIASKKMELVFMILTFLLAGLTRKITLQGVKVKIDIRTRSGHSLALGSLSLLKMENVTLRNHRWSCHWPCFPPCSDLEQTTHLYVVKFRLRLRALQIFHTQNKTWSTWNSSTRWRSPWGMWRSRGWFAWAEMFDTSDLSVKPFSVWTMGKSVEPSIFKFLLSGTSSVSSMSIALLAAKPMNVS